jgi:hypothetical protein
MFIKLPVYLFFYLALGLDDFDGGKSISRAKGWALEMDLPHQNH